MMSGQNRNIQGFSRDINPVVTTCLFIYPVVTTIRTFRLQNYCQNEKTGFSRHTQQKCKVSENPLVMRIFDGFYVFFFDIKMTVSTCLESTGYVSAIKQNMSIEKRPLAVKQKMSRCLLLVQSMRAFLKATKKKEPRDVYI